MKTDRSELFRIACQRNAIRRAAGLPLLDIRREMAGEAHRLAWRAYRKAREDNRKVYQRISADAASELSTQLGSDPLLSAGGRFAVEALAGRRFDQYLASIGYRRPHMVGVRYGDRTTDLPSPGAT